MNVVIREPEMKKAQWKTGDVIEVVFDVFDVVGKYYLIIEVLDKGFMAKSFNGESGFNGYHNSLKCLQESIEYNNNVKHYSQDEYRLSLEFILNAK